MSTKQLPGKIITFYSYKGGTGRSMALANVAWILASNGKSVLVLDWDLEAPGLHRYFRPFLIDKELTSSDGIIDFVIAYADEAIKPPPKGDPLPENWFVPLADITKNAVSINFEGFPDGGSIALIPAGRQGAMYATRVNSFDWKNFYVRLAGRAFMEEARQRMCEEYEYILIDSRTGVSDTSGICTVQMPDILAVCYTLNNQSIEGAAAVTKSVDDQRRKASELDSEQAISRKLKIVPIPMRVDPFEKDKLDRRRAYAQSKFEPFIPEIPIGSRQTYWVEIEVPYTPYFAYEELLSIFRENPSDPKAVLSAMIRITNYLLPPKTIEDKPFTATSLISPQRKDDILKEFAKTPGVDSTTTEQPIAVESDLEKQIRLSDAAFLSLDDHERDAGRRLLTRLVRVPRRGERTEISKLRVDLRDLGEMSSLARKLGQSGLLSFDEDETTGRETVEISNEELLRSWPRLREWIEQDRWLFRWRQELQISMAQWEDSKRQPTELLRGRELDEASQWYKTHRDYLNDDEAAFIETSIRDGKVRRRRLGVIAIAAIVLIGILLPLTLIYYYRTSNKGATVEKIAAEAQRRIQASSSGTQQGEQFQLGILLATEAERFSHSATAEGILRLNLPRLPRRVSTSVQTNNVLRVAMSPNGAQVLAVTGRPRGIQPLSEDRAAQLQEASTAKVITRVPFRPGTRTFEPSSDGKYLATVSGEGQTYTITLFDVAASRTAAIISHKGPVLDMVFSPDGRYFACASADATTQVVSLADPTTQPQKLKQEGTVNAIAFSGDSKFIATAGEDFKVHIWSITPKTGLVVPLKQIRLPGTAFNIALSPSGVYLATIALDNQVVRVWDVANAKLISSLTHDYGINSLVFSPDSQSIITAGNGGKIKVWYPAGKIITSLRFEGDADRVFFSPMGKYLAAIGNSNVARVWSYHDRQFNEESALIQGGNFNDLAFASDATNLAATAGADNTIRVWDLGAALTQDLQSESCARLTRNLTTEEWDRYLSGFLGPYHRTCSDLP